MARTSKKKQSNVNFAEKKNRRRYIRLEYMQDCP